MKETMIEWEKENQGKITGWIADWEINPGFKTVIFSMEDKTRQIFVIPMERTIIENNYY